MTADQFEALGKLVAASSGTSVERVLRALRSMIVDGTFATGSELTENRICESAGVSRTPVREALTSLHSEGLVRKDARTRAWVVVGISSDDLDELFYLREAAEQFAVRKLVARLDEKHVLELRNCVSLMRSAVEKHDMDGAQNQMNRFNHILLDAADAKHIELMLNRIYDYIDRFARGNLMDPRRASASCDEHAAIAEAISGGRRDEALELVRVHIRNAKEATRKRLQAEDAEDVFRDMVPGHHEAIPLLQGGLGQYTNLDNASTTPPLRSVREAVDALLDVYGSIGRGAGFKSRITTAACEAAREMVSSFVGANSEDRATIFTKNATEAINKVARLMKWNKDDVIITTLLEHHSNLLPWRIAAERSGASVVYVGVDPADGCLLMEQLQAMLDQYRSAVRLVAISGASNVTGYVTPLREVAKRVHQHDAYLLVDGAQLVPHLPVDVRPIDDPERIDFLALSGHKMYAPYGAGALIGPKDFFAHGVPVEQGGGMVEVVYPESVRWKEPPAREEAGTPNAVGIVALGVAARSLMNTGMDVVQRRELELVEYALEKLRSIDGLHIYGSDCVSNDEARLGILTFELRGVPPYLISEILAWEYGIATRAGSFCAQPYMSAMRRAGENGLENKMKRDQPVRSSGAVRASLGMYNCHADIDLLEEALRSIARGEYRGRYEPDASTGRYLLVEARPDIESFSPILEMLETRGGD